MVIVIPLAIVTSDWLPVVVMVIVVVIMATRWMISHVMRVVVAIVTMMSTPPSSAAPPTSRAAMVRPLKLLILLTVGAGHLSRRPHHGVVETGSNPRVPDVSGRL